MNSAAQDNRLPFYDFDEIEQGLFLGNWDTATSPEKIEELKVTHVLTAFCCPITVPSHVKTYFADVEDAESADLLNLFEETNHFIKEGQDNGACLVHCLAGISRSSTFVIAYLMNKYNLTFEEAKFRVKQKRYEICPNDGFVEQLRLYQAMGCQLDKQNLRYRLYILQQVKRKIIAENNFSGVSTYVEMSKSPMSGDPFKCKMCRTYLFSESNLIMHSRGSDPSWTRATPTEESHLCTCSMYIEPLAWMTDISTEASGKIYCPKCHSKLGEFKWSGEDCSCRSHIVPSFRIVLSDVDRDRTLN